MTPLARLRKFTNLRLSTRIAAATLIALLAVQALNAAAFYLTAPPGASVYSARWLLNRTGKVAAAVFAADQAERRALARSLGNSELRISWRPKLDPVPPPDHLPFLERLKASLDVTLAGKILQVKTGFHAGPPGAYPAGSVRSVPAGFISALPSGPLAAGEPDFPVSGHFVIALQGQDESWVVVEPAPPHKFTPLLNPWLITAAGAVVVIAAMSVWTARLWLRPMDRLAEAAERLGRTRELTPVETTGLQDFKAVGEALNGMQTRIKRFVDERTQMLAAISHDLRTPLTRMRLTAEELPDGSVRDRLIADAEEMEGMIAATLAFAAGDLTGGRQERADLAALLISICDDFSDQGLPAAYSGPCRAVILCQPAALKRAFTNLISNAIKYGHEAGVDLTAGADGVTVTIADRGPGIPADQVDLAFQPFRRLESSRNRETGGAGLGLAIARDIVQAHGGGIRLANRAEGGLEAMVRLPAARRDV